MTDLDPRILERFREFEGTLRALWEGNTQFNAKVHQYTEVAEGIARVEIVDVTDSSEVGDISVLMS